MESWAGNWSKFQSPALPISNSRWPTTFGAWALACVEDEALHTAADRHPSWRDYSGQGAEWLSSDGGSAQRRRSAGDLTVRKVRPDKPLAVMVRDLGAGVGLVRNLAGC